MAMRQGDYSPEKSRQRIIKKNAKIFAYIIKKVYLCSGFNTKVA